MPDKKKEVDTSNKRTPPQIEADKVFMADKLVQGYPMSQIAVLLNEHNDGKYTLGRTQVFNDCKAVMKDWQDERNILMDYKLENELRKIDKIENECWIEWEKSKRQKRKAKIEGGEITPSGATQGKIKERTVEDMTGNVRYLERIQWCIDKRAELYGLKTININQTKRIDPEQIKKLSNLPKKVLDELRRHLD